jgi:hypothetical protein
MFRASRCIRYARARCRSTTTARGSISSQVASIAGGTGVNLGQPGRFDSMSR